MAKTKKKPESGGLDLIENPEAFVSKTEEFFNNKKNQNIVFGVGGFIAIVVFAFMGYKYYIQNRNNEAQEEMFQAVYYFEADSLGKALNGDGNNYGFLDIADLYSGTKAANLSKFYIGSIYMKMSDFDNAIRYFDDFSGSDMLLQARAYSLTGDAYMELEDFEGAISYYRRASDYKPNEGFTPAYLSKLALAYEMNGEFGEAANAYATITENYPNSPESTSAKKHKARLEGLIVE